MRISKLLAAGVIAVGLISAGGAASADTATTHVDDCTTATAGASIGYPTGCAFLFFDGNATLTSIPVGKYKDTTSNAGNETEVFTGSGLANSTGAAVTYSPANNPNGPTQTCFSFYSGKTTLNWAMTIQTTGSWNLTCNFQKKSS